MLNEYIKAHAKVTIQYFVVDHQGIVLESDNALFSKVETKNISELHPFYESLIPLLNLPDEEFIFSCIHLNIDQKSLIADVTLKTFKEKPSLLMVQDLTTHYNNYQLTAQIRNESVINSQVLELKNNYLKEKEEFKNTFIANFSHEIREPLSGIGTFTNILSKTDLSPEQKDYVNIISSTSNHLKHMIEDILDISKIEVGKLNLIEESFALKTFIENVVFAYKVQAQQKEIDLTYTLDARLPEVIIGDQYRLKQILNNLLDNALKYTTHGSVNLKLSLNQVRAKKASIHFEISDTGIGIEEGNLNKVFNSFEQLDSALPKKGTGLGLAIVKNLVELMHGNISIQSEINKGTTLSLNISFKIDEQSKKVIKKAEVPEIVKSKKKYNILLVEHSEMTQLSVLKILAGHGNFYLDIISNPNDVIPAIISQNVDLVLMDINLPGITGDELTTQIRQLPEKEHKKVPVIAITGKVFAEDLKRYKKAKMNDIIKKPFDEKSLLKTIHKYLK